MSHTWFNMSSAAREQPPEAQKAIAETFTQREKPMNKPYAYLYSVLATLLAVACLSVPARAAAQATPSPYCYQCKAWEVNKNYFECNPDDNLWGHLVCQLSNGGKTCTTSSLPSGGADCIVVPTLAGRVSPDVESEPWPLAVNGTGLSQRVRQAVPAVDVVLEVARHGCTGAIIQRRYSSARIAELRSDLRHVSI